MCGVARTDDMSKWYERIWLSWEVEGNGDSHGADLATIKSTDPLQFAKPAARRNRNWCDSSRSSFIVDAKKLRHLLTARVLYVFREKVPFSVKSVPCSTTAPDPLVTSPCLFRVTLWLHLEVRIYWSIQGNDLILQSIPNTPWWIEVIQQVYGLTHHKRMLSTWILLSSS